MMGHARMNSPSTMPAGVNRRPSPPRGPCLPTSPYRKRPTTTVGSAMRVLSSSSSAFRPRNRLREIQSPAGTLTRAARIEAVIEIRNEVQTMKYTSGSKSVRSPHAAATDERI